MANGFMNPYGAPTPFLFGEDPASQEAQRAYSEAAGKVGEFIFGSGEPMTVDGQPVATGEPFFGLLGPSGPAKLGGLPKLSRFAPKGAKTSDAPMLPVLRQGQALAVPGGRPPAVRPTGTVIPMGTTPAAPTSNLLRDLLATGAAVGGTAALMNALSGDQEDVATPTIPQGFAPSTPTVPQPQLTTVPGLEGGFGGMSLSEFLAPVRAEREAARSAFEQASREREARLAQEERIREAQRTGSKAAIDAVQESIFGESKDGGLGDFMTLARAAGAKGSAVKATAERLKEESERKAAESAADIAATEALAESRRKAKVEIPSALKDLNAVEQYFGIIGVPFRDAQGNLTEEAREAIAARGRLGEGVLGSGIGETILLDREGKKRSVPSDQVEAAIASGYTREA
jgi:hypothetical protein